jgi:hypothetical protein
MPVRVEPDCLNCVDLEDRSQFQAAYFLRAFDRERSNSCRTGFLPKTIILVGA